MVIFYSSKIALIQLFLISFRIYTTKLPMKPNNLVLQVPPIGRPNEVLVNQLVGQIAKLRFIPVSFHPAMVCKVHKLRIENMKVTGVTT